MLLCLNSLPEIAGYPTSRTQQLGHGYVSLWDKIDAPINAAMEHKREQHEISGRLFKHSNICCTMLIVEALGKTLWATVFVLQCIIHMYNQNWRSRRPWNETGMIWILSTGLVYSLVCNQRKGSWLCDLNTVGMRLHSWKFTAPTLLLPSLLPSPLLPLFLPLLLLPHLSSPHLSSPTSSPSTPPSPTPSPPLCPGQWWSNSLFLL